MTTATTRSAPSIPSHLAGSPVVEAYCRKTATSARLAAQARQVFPSGITHDSRHLEPHPIYVVKADKARKWDVDGNEYVDYAGGHGAMLLGHSHPAIVQAVQEQIGKGTHYGSCHELELEWGQLVQEMVPCAERVRLHSSGTEATMLAIRLARAFTGKKKLLRFIGHFHGWHDHAAFGVFGHFDGTPTPGVLPEIAANVVLAPPWNFAKTRELIESRDDIAVAIIEPTGSSWGQVPVTPEFLKSLRHITAERGIVLIFDEVISGFRASAGGAQAALGITPDMASLGKIVAGGMTGAALVGRQDIMELLDFRRTSQHQQEKVAHFGTYNAMPPNAAAAVRALKIVRDTDVCQRAHEAARRLRAALNEVIRSEDLPWVVYGTYSSFHIFTNPNHIDATPEKIESGQYDFSTLKAQPQPATLVNKLRLGMMIHGADIFSWPGGPVSAVHSDADIEQTAEAMRQSIRMLKDEGEIEK